MDPLEKTESERAWADLSVRCTVFVIPEGPLANPACSVGSATLLRSPRNHVFLLTARHIAEDVRRGQIWFGHFNCTNAIKTGIAGALLHPNADVDAALLLLKRKDQTKLTSYTRSSATVSEDSGVANGDYLAICGYPWELQHLDQQRPQQGFTSLFYNCILESPAHDDLGRLRLAWGKFEAERSAIVPPAPPGTSGGGLWRRRDQGQLIWTPDNTITIVGIQSAWERANQIALVEPSSRWFSWYVDSLGKLDEDEFASQEAG